MQLNISLSTIKEQCKIIIFLFLKEHEFSQLKTHKKQFCSNPLFAFPVALFQLSTFMVLENFYDIN